MGLEDGKSFSQLGKSCELVAVSKRDSPPDPVHCAEVEQSMQMICKCPTPRSLCTSICLTLVAQILRNELTQKMFPLPAATPSQTKLLGRSGCTGRIKASGLGWQYSALFTSLHIHGTVNPRQFNNIEFCICYIS